MRSREYIDLKKTDGARFFIRPSELESSKEDLENLLKGDSAMYSKAFAKKVLFSHEIKANNQVEGYGDDISQIKKAIENASAIKDEQQRMRILNLYHAYRYILTHDTIDKNSLKELYSITSGGLLDGYSKTNMGEYYRNKPVYILQNGRLDMNPDEGVDADKIDEFMDAYFEFLNKSITGSETEEYVKSQILHFYFVYIHPYFDVNGRTSRTLAMWYLLNKKAYPYIIFNRGISFKGSIYDKTIVQSKTTNDLTYFIELMLETVKIELEKEYYMQAAAYSASEKLTATDFQTLLYFLSMKGLRTVLDFARIYNQKCEPKKIREIYNEMIVPLLDKGILDIKGETKKTVQGITNKILVLRPIDINHEKVKDLNLN